jgi:hypothetical protein
MYRTVYSRAHSRAVFGEMSGGVSVGMVSALHCQLSLPCLKGKERPWREETHRHLCCSNFSAWRRAARPRWWSAVAPWLIKWKGGEAKIGAKSANATSGTQDKLFETRTRLPAACHNAAVNNALPLRRSYPPHSPRVVCLTRLCQTPAEFIFDVRPWAWERLACAAARAIRVFCTRTPVPKPSARASSRCARQPSKPVLMADTPQAAGRPICLGARLRGYMLAHIS